MNSMPSPAGTADDVLAARADERLAHAYQQITQADEQLARLTEQMSRLERDGAGHPSVVSGVQPSRGGALLRGLTGLVLAAGIGAAAFAAQSPYGEPAKSIIAQWVPQFVLTSPPQSRPPAAPAEAVQPSVQLASADATPSQPVASLTPAQDVAPAPLPPELTQLLQSMAHDIAVVQQGIEQLKASQERMFADTARAIEQVKANQEQSTRLAAKPPQRPAEKPPEPDRRAAAPASPARPPTVANAAHKPPPAAPQAGARAQPIQLQPADQ